VDTVVKGRHCHPSEKFREYAVTKVERLERFGVPITRVDVELSKEKAPRQAATCERVELTISGKGPVVRAEASAADPLAALDLVLDKVEARLRKAADRRRVHHGSRGPATVRHGIDVDGALVGELLTAPTGSADTANSDTANSDTANSDTAPAGYAEPDGPFVVREKTHAAPPMDIEQALERMELVGHDFFLFHDVVSGAPSVVYRRRAYDYGVLHLSVVDA
jgi:ribosomal subunit interface protein